MKPNQKQPPPGFNPSFMEIFTNGSYIIRRLISGAIRENADLLGNKVLDYGCGSKPYQCFFPECDYIGADVRVSGHPNELKEADIFFDDMRLPVADNEFDGILASEVIEHVFDLETCLSDMFRVLKPGGKLLITCPFIWPLHEEPYDFARYTPHALEQEVEKAGFKLIKQEQLGNRMEVISQILILLFPYKLIGRIPIVSKFILAVFYGSMNGLAKMSVAYFKPRPKGLYITNLLIAEKPLIVIKYTSYPQEP